jgi:hypothetical protein
MKFFIQLVHITIELMAIKKNLSFTYPIIDSTTRIGLLDGINEHIFKNYNHTNTWIFFLGSSYEDICNITIGSLI